MNCLLTGILFFWVQIAVAAQTTNAPVRSLALIECIQIALEHNFDVKIEQKSVDIARHRLSFEYDAYDPILSGSMSRGHSLSPGGIDEQNRAFSGTTTDRDRFSAGLDGLFPSGLTYELGTGFLESAYRNALCLELKIRGVSYDMEKPIIVKYRGQPIAVQRIDLIVESAVIVELKAVEALTSIHQAQLMSYMRASAIRAGLLMNFGGLTLKQG